MVGYLEITEIWIELNLLEITPSDSPLHEYLDYIKKQGNFITCLFVKYYIKTDYGEHNMSYILYSTCNSSLQGL